MGRAKGQSASEQDLAFLVSVCEDAHAQIKAASRYVGLVILSVGVGAEFGTAWALMTAGVLLIGLGVRK